MAVSQATVGGVVAHSNARLNRLYVYIAALENVATQRRVVEAGYIQADPDALTREKHILAELEWTVIFAREALTNGDGNILFRAGGSLYALAASK